jgi:hypothetical protein
MCLNNTDVLAAATWAVCWAEGAEEPDCDHIGYSPFTIRKEICGSDGQTYTNGKHLEFENCLYKRGEENGSAYNCSRSILPNNVSRFNLGMVDCIKRHI